MIVAYLDSSLLVRVCVQEGETRLIEEAMSHLSVTSALASVEVPIAIQARFHRGAIDAEARDLMIEIANSLLESIERIGLSSSVRQEAVAVASGRRLRSLDAIHVGTAAVVARQQRRRGNELHFYTADERQGEAARSCLGDDRVHLFESRAALEN